jgi:hypothetical protein
MQVMQKKILDWRELWHSMESILFVIGAIRDRVDDLNSMSTILSLQLGTLEGRVLPLSTVDSYLRQRFGYIRPTACPLTRFSTLTLPIFVDIFSQQKHDPERHFQTFAYGIVRYVFFIRSVLPSEVFGL